MTRTHELASQVTTTCLDEAREEAGQNEQLSQVVSFQLANETYGLNIMDVQEIILLGEITGIPEVPAYIRGVINLRGKVLPVVDLRLRLGLRASGASEHTRIIVVHATGMRFGIIVDGVSQVVRVDTEQVEPPPTGLTGSDRAYLLGLVKMDEKIMILLNAEAILSNDTKDRLAQVAKGEA